MSSSDFFKGFVFPFYKLNFGRAVVGYANFSFVMQKPSDVPMVDTKVVDKKFRIWQEVCNSGLLTSEDEYVRSKAWSLLNDKTLMAYHYFKFDGKPMKLRWYQDAILSDDHDRILFVAANQIGKSLTLDVDAAVTFLRDHGKGWVGILVSSSLPQSMFQMDRIKMLLRSADINYREEDTTETKTGKKDNSTTISYTFYSGDGQTPLYTNLLICCPHTSSALGYPADDIWLDEFDFWKDVVGGQEHFLNQVIIPRTFETNGRIKIFSNPDGADKLLAKLFHQKDDLGVHVWHRYQFNMWDRPGISQEEFNKKKVGMTRQQVDSTLLAVFSSSAGAFLSSDEIKDQISLELCEKGDSAGYGRECAFFLDVGSVHDQCVLVGGYLDENIVEPDIPLINVFYIHKYPVGYPISRVVGISVVDDGWDDEAEDNRSVKSVLLEYSQEVDGFRNYPLFGVDVTGNSGISPLFNVAGIDPVNVTFSGPRKWAMYQRYQYYSQQRYFKRARDRDANAVNGNDFSYQASKLRVKQGTSTGYRQIHHEQESDLDDTQDATVGLIYLIENPDLPSLSYDIINNGKSVLSDIEEEKRSVDEFKENHPELKDQYIPSFMRNDELDSWIGRREKNRR